MACDNCGVEYHGKNLVLVHGEESLCSNCLWAELARLRERVEQLRTERNARQEAWEIAETERINLRTELTQLREQSAREHIDVPEPYCWGYLERLAYSAGYRKGCEQSAREHAA